MSKGEKFSELRKKAEDILKLFNHVDTVANNTDLAKLLHELDTYRIELELQNEELQLTNAELNSLQDELEEEISVHFRHYDIAPVGYVTIDVYKNIVYEITMVIFTDVFFHLLNRFAGVQNLLQIMDRICNSYFH